MRETETDNETETEMDTVIVGSGNVFADLGLPNPEERLAKAMLSRTSTQILKKRGWTQARAARAVGIAASDMSDIVRGKLRRFSLDRLESVILNLDMDIDILISPKRVAGKRGQVRVQLVDDL